MSDLKEWMNPLVPADTRVQIADGEIERLRVCLSKANEQAEHFEREWYLRGDELEQLRAELAASREREARMRALIADDGHAMTFQSLGQYRTALLRALAEGAQG